MRFHFLMLIIVILVSLGMHGMASAGVARLDSSKVRVPGSVSGAPAGPF